jgi:hypothetical protein
MTKKQAKQAGWIIVKTSTGQYAAIHFAKNLRIAPAATLTTILNRIKSLSND